MAFFTRSPKLRPVAPGDPGYATVLASLTTAPGAARETVAAELAASLPRPSSERPVEYYVYDGQDGRPAAIATITPHADEPGVAEAWLAVDPTLRNFGLGEQVWELTVARLKRLKITRVLSYATQHDGLAFLSGHGFTPTNTEGADPGAFRVEAELTL